jgi:hypothetical protein
MFKDGMIRQTSIRRLLSPENDYAKRRHLKSYEMTKTKRKIEDKDFKVLQ